MIVRDIKILLYIVFFHLVSALSLGPQRAVSKLSAIPGTTTTLFADNAEPVRPMGGLGLLVEEWFYFSSANSVDRTPAPIPTP
jgi:hypothetical protein